MKRLLIINRKWHPGYQLPRLFKAETQLWKENWNAYEEVFCSRYLSSDGYFESSSLDCVINNGSESQDFILRTEFELPMGLGQSHEEEQNSLVNLFTKPLRRGDATSPFFNTKILFLFHNAKGLAPHTGFQHTHIRTRTFGGGKSIIYGSRGLLGPDRKYFYSEEFDLAIEQSSSGIYKITKPENFGRVWTYYWSQSEKRLRVMANEVKNALIPSYPLERKKFAQDLVKNFLTHLDNKSSDSGKIVAEGSLYDFSTCEDLEEIRKILMENFSDLHHELKNFAANPEKSTPEVFHQDLDSFIQKVAER